VWGETNAFKNQTIVHHSQKYQKRWDPYKRRRKNKIKIREKNKRTDVNTENV
jgi:hypothetical protein